MPDLAQDPALDPAVYPLEEALILFLTGDSNRVELLDMLQGYGPEDMVVAELSKLPVPNAHEVLWLQAVGSAFTHDSVHALSDCLREVNPEHGPWLVTDFSCDVKTLNRSELETLRGLVDELLAGLAEEAGPTPEPS